MVGVGSQTRNAFSTANTEHHSNGGSSEEALFVWTDSKSLKDLGARHAPGKKLSFLVQSWDEITTLYCQTYQKNDLAAATPTSVALLSHQERERRSAVILLIRS